MEVVDQVERRDYETFLTSRYESNFLQSWQWGELHENLNMKVFRSGIKHGKKLAAVWSGIVKDAKRGRYLEIPGGPIMDWTDRELVSSVMGQIRRLAKQEACVFVRFRPQQENESDMLSILQHHKTSKAPMHLHAEHTSILDITPSEDDLMTGMRRQTRYEVRQVAKKDVKITSRTPTEADIDQFYGIQSETAKRHGFVQSSREFFQSMREAFGENLQLYLAEKDDELLNLALVIHYGNESDYFEAASTPAARRMPGAYGIVWQAIVDAKKLGSKRLNFWGIAYSDDPNHRYAGVTTFKRGFGGRDVEYVSAHDMVINRYRYWINWLIETVRRKRRGL